MQLAGLDYNMSMYSKRLSPKLQFTFCWNALLNLIQANAGTFVADVDQIRPQYSTVTEGGNVFQSSVVRGAGSSVPADSYISALDSTIVNAVGQGSVPTTPWYSDQVMPFDITLAGANEYGAMC